MDTEFIWQTTYWPKPAIIQGAHGGRAYIFDGTDLQDQEKLALTQLLSNPKLLKIFHAPRDDLIILHRLTGVWVDTYVDTQLAALFCGEEQALGLDRLCNKVLGVEIDKTHQVSDWLARPLSQAQIDYAIQDVTYLEEVWQKQAQILEPLGYMDWLEEDLTTLVETISAPQDPWQAWRAVPPRSTEPRAMAYAQALAAWRELYAQKVDKAVGRVLSNDALSQWAADPCGSKEAWRSRLRRARLKLSEDDHAQFMAYMEKAEALGPENCPLWPHRRFTKREENQLKRLKRLLKRVAQEYNLPPFLIASKKQLTRFIFGRPNALEQGWRYEIFGKLAKEEKCP